MAHIGYNSPQPQFGFTDYRHSCYFAAPVLTGAGNVTGAHVYCHLMAPGGLNQIRVHLYTYDAVKANCLYVGSSATTAVVNTVVAWVPLTMSAVLMAGTQYLCDFQMYNSVASRLRVGAVNLGAGTEVGVGDIDFNAPATLAAFGSDLYATCAYMDFSGTAPALAGNKAGVDMLTGEDVLEI